MELIIEKWLKENCHIFDDNIDSLKLFEESIMCYKVGIYRSAFIMSYLALETILKFRMISLDSLPADYVQPEWDLIKSKLQDDNQWEAELFNRLILSKPDPNSGKVDKRIFRYRSHEPMIIALKNWRNIRNACAHFKHNTIDQSTVYSYWNFIMDEIDEFQIGGGMEHLEEEILKSLDISKSSEKESYNKEVLRMNRLMESTEICQLIGRIAKKYDRLHEKRIEDNYFKLWKELLYSKERKLSDAVYLYLNSESIHDKFFFILENFKKYAMILLIENHDYRKKVWDNYTDKYNIQFLSFDSSRWLIFKAFIEKKLLVRQEKQIFFEKLIENHNSIHYLYYDKDQELINILNNEGFLDMLLANGSRINFSDWDTANRNEYKLFLIVKYCEFSKWIYDAVYYLVKQRNPKTTIYDELKKIICNDPVVTNKVKAFEQGNNESSISSYFGI